MKKFTIIDQVSGSQFSLYDSYLDTILRKFEGFEYASVKTSIDDVAGPYGAVYVTSKFGQRRVAIEGDLVSDNVFAQRRQLLEVLRQTGTIKLMKFITYDDLELQFEAEVVKLTEPYNHSVHTFLLEMIAPDWRFYSQELKTATIARTVLLGGTSIPLPSVPFGLPLDTTPETDISDIVNNIGNDNTDPIFTITGPGTNFTITNNTTGETFTLTAVLTDSDTVVIDVRARTVVKNGITNLYPNLTGELWSVVPGENEINFFIDSGFTALTTLSLAYRDAYIGI